MAINSSWLGRWLVQRARRLLGYDTFLVRRSAGDINAAFLDWLDEGGTRDDGAPRPFFAFLNYMDAHGPYVPPDSLAERFGPRRNGRAMADLSSRQDWSAEELAVERAAYDSEIAYVDQEIGAVVAALEERGLLDETLLVIASDHGELFGEHGLVDHGNSLYREVIDVPLVVVFPGRVPEGGRIGETITLRDLAATISHMATGAEHAFPGSSLSRFWEPLPPASSSPILSSVSGGVRMPDWVPVSKGDMKSLVSDGYQYIIDGEGSEELYRYGAERGETGDLSASAAEGARLAEMRRSAEQATATGTEQTTATGSVQADRGP
jgi:arylsulfatase A-like enzyme